MFSVSKKILSAAILLPAMLWADRVEQNFGGIGVQIFNNGKFPQVAMVIPGTPADAAGILPGDRIEAADGASLEGLTSDQATEAMRGEAGREIVLSVRRGDELLEVKAVRVRLAVKMESCGELREKRSGAIKGSDVRSALNAGRFALLSVDAAPLADSDALPEGCGWGYSVAMPDREADARDASKAAKAASANKERLYTVDGKSWSGKRLKDLGTPSIQ